MGAAWFISLERKIPDFNECLEVDGKSLPKARDELDTMAKQLAVTPLFEFFDASRDEMTVLLGEEATEGWEDQEPRWFAASEGLKTTTALINHVQSEPNSVPRADRVLQDLRNFEKILTKADTEDIRWHLSIDI
jgi:hypothetical protein